VEHAAMSTTEALRAAQDAGVTVTLDGEGLVLEANTEPPQAVLDRALDCCARGRAVLAGTRSDRRRLVERSGVGV
jgi:hypothetical protein